MRLAIEHVTTYHFGAPVRHGLQRLRLTPLNGRGQQVIAWDLACENAVLEVAYDDEYANRVTLVSLAAGARSVTIRAAGLVETSDEAGVSGRHAGHLPLWHFVRPTRLTTPGAGIAALAEGLDPAGDTLTVLHALSARVAEAVTYAAGHTDVATSAEAALGLGRGVCQDQAHVFIAAARLLGIPARYVSGHLLIAGREEQEAGHGWAEGHVEGLGWVGFDVANAICPDDRYVRLAVGRDYADAAPVRGMIAAQSDGEGRGADRMSIAVTVRAITDTE